MGPVNSAVISVASESVKNGSKTTILDYLPDRAVLITDPVSEIQPEIEKAISSIIPFDNSGEEHTEKSQEEPGKILLEWNEINLKIINSKHWLVFSSWSAGDSAEVIDLKSFFLPVERFNGALNKFIENVRRLLFNIKQIVIISQQTERLFELITGENIPVIKVTKQMENSSPGRILLAHDSLSEGWRLGKEILVFSDNEIFGITKRHRQVKRNAVRHHLYITELKKGDYIVHVEHGVGKYLGLIKVSNEAYEREYLLLEYASGDKLYVPADQMDRVSRYIGSGEQQPRLSRLGTQEWKQTKEKIRKSVREMAEELLQLYARRESVSGFTYTPDNLWQAEMESAFPFVETRDQLEAIKAVKEDMETSKPMDRLICGDVGYGKTEIALRAAFKAVLNNKQVALLVPTTLLAQQHLESFQERLKPFPVRIAALSRFSTEKEQASILKDLALGSIDICIGTHRLLQKDVVFKDLGLLIVDEEQRFGVVHKEYFKKIRASVDILTLSATPIPRTLHMSLSGIKDLSVMETPPEERLPIKTHVGNYNDTVVRNAIMHELMRHGQIFYVHNRVRDLMSVADKVQSLVPESRILVAHGQMPEDDLERIMSDFYDHKADILLTTTIIESGLDIPNVNTLIVDNSDKFGLTQMYQLRGRIGRSNTASFAYFLYNGNKRLTYQARERLRTIAEATELGAGFAIAMRDLEIRGAGNLLGSEQSGYIAAVGFDLYCRLLSEAVESVKNEKSGNKINKQISEVETAVTIDLPLKAYIPESYVPNLDTRMEYYQKLATLKDINIRDFMDELTDRFGPVEKPVVNLLYMINIKKLALKAGVESIITMDKSLVLNCGARGKAISLNLSAASKTWVNVGNRQIKIDFRTIGERWQTVLVEILKQMANG
jgi:transcription-repair coupling factor (superfamily II helicase)